MTPAPGAVGCLQNGEQDLRSIMEYLGCGFDDARLEEELKNSY